MKQKSGLARIVSRPAQPEYLAAQFLGNMPAVVPAVLNDELRLSPVPEPQGDGSRSAF